MAGIVADCKLSTRFAIATDADEAAIRRLLRDNPMHGAISLSFEREPDYSRGMNLAGGSDQTVLAYANSQVVGMGRCTQRDCWLNGAARNTGYLGELRLDATVRGRYGILRDGYSHLLAMQREAPADFYFTSIAADNGRVRRLFENETRGLPHYGFLAELDTLLITVPRNPRAVRLRVVTATPSHIPDMIHLLNSPQQQLAAVWTAERLLSLDKHDLPLSRFRLAFDGAQLVGCGALWDQRQFRQTVIRGYSRALGIARPLLNFVGRIVGTPRLPPVNSVLAHAFLSPLAMARHAENRLPEFIESFLTLASQSGIEFLTLALPSDDARLPALRKRYTTRTWRSRLYRVDWPEFTPLKIHTKGAVFLPDVALL